MEGLDKDWKKDPALQAKYPDIADYAVHIFAFYMCFKCKVRIFVLQSLSITPYNVYASRMRN